ncbi:MAG: MFS transporter [Bacillota bacterium]|nr:MFS transporter [Bacillota bacterium]
MTVQQPASVVEEASFSPFLKKLTVFCSGGPFLDGYILVIIGSALSQLGPELGLDSFWTGMIGASSLLGLFIGGAIFGYVTDLMGRQLMYMIDLVTIIVCSIVQMFVHTPTELFILRFIIGMAVGADYPIATSLLAEFSPRKYRGFMLGILMIMWYVGATVADIVGYALYDVAGGWRWMLGSAAIPAIIIVLGRFGTPESPRWLVSKNRIEEARAVLKKVYGPDAELSDLEQTTEKTKFSKIFEAEYLKRTIFTGMFWMCQIVPLFAIYTFGPVILNQFGLATGKFAIMGDILISSVFLIGCVPAIFLVNTWGRRPLIISCFAFMALGMLILGIFPTANPWIIILGFSIYAFFSGGPNVLEWVYPNELFPTEIRASAVGIATAVSRIGAAIGTFALPYLLKSIGVGTTMVIMAVITFVGLIVCVGLAPETKGLTLSQASSISMPNQRSSSFK